MDLRPLVLALLEAKPLHGYELVRVAQARGKLRWEEGTVYPLLHRLEGEGLLSSRWRRGPLGRERKYYALTRRGRGALAEARREYRRQVRLLLGGSHA